MDNHQFYQIIQSIAICGHVTAPFFGEFGIILVTVCIIIKEGIILLTVCFDKQFETGMVMDVDV